MFFFLSKTLDALLSPLTWALLLLFAGALRRRSVPLWAPLGAIAILGFFSLEPVSNALVRRSEMSAQRTDSQRMTYDVVILLGGMVEEAPTQTSGLPSYNEHLERLLTTFDVLRSGHAKQAIISGGAMNPNVPVVEARTLASQLKSWGIEPDRLIVEDRARNTRENALFSKQIVDSRHLRTILLVTSASHEPRAVACFRAVGLDVDTLPVDYHGYDPSLKHASLIPRAEKLADSTAALRELIGRFVYSIVGYGKG